MLILGIKFFNCIFSLLEGKNKEQVSILIKKLMIDKQVDDDQSSNYLSD